MKEPNNKDLETISLFFILGLLTLVVVLLMKVVLFGPGLTQFFEMGVK